MNPNRIIVHRTGSRFLRNLACGSERNYVIENGVLSRDGAIYEYEKPKENINIALQGVFDNVKRDPTEKQWESLVKLVSEKCKEYGIPLHQIYGHMESDSSLRSDTGCPGLRVDLGRLFLDVRLNVDVEDKDIVGNNLRLMKRGGSGTLAKLLGHEATICPIRENVSRTGVEFSYDADSGEIYYFGYWQSIPDSLKAASHPAEFVIEIDFKERKTRIVKIIYTHWIAQSMRNERSRENLEESVRMFNEFDEQKQ